jgi:LCP family protein required for cell wall assembly
VIVLAIRNGSKIGLVSVPRDLYVEDLCAGGMHRISSAYSGCGETHGLAHLVRELENVSGLDIEHAAAVDLAGFPDVIDAVGGYEICTDYPVRDLKSGLRLESGCTMADGEATLQWVRSRSTERLVDGEWRPVPDVSDLTRNARQRQLLVDVLHRQSGRNDPRAILELVRSAAPHLTIDDQLSLVDAASWLWDYRNAEVNMAEIPVAYQRTGSGASVLVPTVDVASFLHGLAS